MTIAFCVEHAIASDIRGVERGIFGVHVKNTAIQSANGDRNIDTLPEKVAGIEIHADVFPSSGAQAQSRLAEIRAQLGLAPAAPAAGEVAPPTQDAATEPAQEPGTAGT